jgi:subtilisin family serine protease
VAAIVCTLKKELSLTSINHLFALSALTLSVTTFSEAVGSDINQDRCGIDQQSFIECSSEIVSSVSDMNTIPHTDAVFSEITRASNPPEVKLIGKSSPNSIYIVQLSDSPVSSYRGNVAGFQATNPSVRGDIKLDASAPASIAYKNHLKGIQAQAVSSVELAIGRSLNVRFTYQHAFNGFAAEMSSGEAAVVAGLPGVAMVEKEIMHYIDTDAGPQWIGADQVWTGTSTGGVAGTQGEGIVIGVIDSGANLDHPSFAEVGPMDGYVHINPLGADNFLGLCDTDPGTWACNDKLIGYYIFTGETTEDTDGHGSHTAGTAAGNHLAAGTVVLGAFSYSPPISGIAPHANIIAYDACNDSGSCPGSATIAAVDQATIDGVDVINYSISGGGDPWTSTISQAFLAAQNAGVIVVESAGNSGPDVSTTAKSSPWTVVVGASTHNRSSQNSLKDMGGVGNPPADIPGRGFAEGYGPAPIVYAGDFGDALCLSPFPPGSWTNGEIVVCDRGVIARVEKGWNVLQGGAGGFVLANNNPDDSLNNDVHHLPAVHIDSANAVALKTWLADDAGHMATISGAIVDTSTVNGDIIWNFSSRGPLATIANDLIKPDVTAPGVEVLAAYFSGSLGPTTTAVEYNIMSGTSMSAPHAAGSMALLRSLFPTYSPSEIKSILMLGASTTDLYKEDGTTPSDPFDRGAGRVDLGSSPTVGLTMHIDNADFTAANPAIGGDPKTLNLASLGNSLCRVTCSWTRTVTNRSGKSRVWEANLIDLPVNVTGSVLPDSFSLADGDSQTITITVDVSAATSNQWYFARLALAEAPIKSGLAIPTSHMPIAIKALPENIFKDGFEPSPGY